MQAFMAIVMAAVASFCVFQDMDRKLQEARYELSQQQRNIEDVDGIFLASVQSFKHDKQRARKQPPEIR